MDLGVTYRRAAERRLAWRPLPLVGEATSADGTIANRRAQSQVHHHDLITIGRACCAGVETGLMRLEASGSAARSPIRTITSSD
jgi:hypothetical protein